MSVEFDQVTVPLSAREMRKPKKSFLVKMGLVKNGAEAGMVLVAASLIVIIGSGLIAMKVLRKGSFAPSTDRRSKLEMQMKQFEATHIRTQ